MSLTVGLNIARSALASVSAQTQIVSSNIANANDPDYTHRSANLVTRPGGGVYVESIARSANKALLDALISETSLSASQQAIVDALEGLQRTVIDPQDGRSPAALIGKLADAIQDYSSGSGDPIRAQVAVSRAVDLARGLNEATATVQAVREQADADMSASVSRINALLREFETANKAVVRGDGTSGELSDHLDTRDRVLKELSAEIGITTTTRARNDIVIFTDSGVTLFETRPRPVTMAPTASFLPGITGNAVYVDNVPVTGGTSGQQIKSGALKGLADIRDSIAVTYQNQLDEIARGLVELFAEGDQSVPAGLPDATGLFTYLGAPAVPAAGTIVTGLAGQIGVNAAVDPQQGGDPALLRDGGINGAAYVYNTAGAAGFTDRLQDLLDGFQAQRSFDSTAGIEASATLIEFSISSVGWLETLRQSTASEAQYRQTLLNRASQALSNETGVNIDEEMTKLLGLERSYQASANLITVIDNMFAALLTAIR